MWMLGFKLQKTSKYLLLMVGLAKIAGTQHTEKCIAANTSNKKLSTQSSCLVDCDLLGQIQVKVLARKSTMTGNVLVESLEELEEKGP